MPNTLILFLFTKQYIIHITLDKHDVISDFLKKAMYMYFKHDWNTLTSEVNWKCGGGLQKKVSDAVFNIPIYILSIFAESVLGKWVLEG